MDLKSTNQISIQELHVKIGQNVKKYREERGMTQLELSQAIGHTTTTMVSLAEIGKGKHFNIEHLHKISIVLDVDICKLFDLN